MNRKLPHIEAEEIISDYKDYCLPGMEIACAETHADRLLAVLLLDGASDEAQKHYKKVLAAIKKKK